MNIETFLLFFGSTFLISATPGPNMLLAFQYGINFGIKKTLWTLVGLSFGLFLLLLLALLSIDTLTKQLPWTLTIIKIVGAFYLAFLGQQSWLHAKNNNELMTNNSHISQAQQVLQAKQAKPWQMFKKGMFVSLSNPKAILFFAAFFPKFINFNAPLLTQYVILTFGFFLSETIWQSAYLFSGKNLAYWLQTSNRLIWLNRICGLLFIAIAVLMLWELF
ncbi:MAG: threonine transporter RhtB [Gammaproteobacteria bacterium]|nr:MAG: threonine transporter RhtB [Gammaproteobacteria bacterium]